MKTFLVLWLLLAFNFSALAKTEVLDTEGACKAEVDGLRTSYYNRSDSKGWDDYKRDVLWDKKVAEPAIPVINALLNKLRSDSETMMYVKSYVDAKESGNGELVKALGPRVLASYKRVIGKDLHFYPADLIPYCTNSKPDQPYWHMQDAKTCAHSDFLGTKTEPALGVTSSWGYSISLLGESNPLIQLRTFSRDTMDVRQHPSKYVDWNTSTTFRQIDVPPRGEVSFGPENVASLESYSLADTKLALETRDGASNINSDWTVPLSESEYILQFIPKSCLRSASVSLVKKQRIQEYDTIDKFGRGENSPSAPSLWPRPDME